MNLDELFLNSSKIPNPLTDKETNDFFYKMHEGDKGARKKLILHNIKLVLYEVNGRFKSINCDKKDMISSGCVGLIKAVDSFDIDKKNKFSTFAVRCIDNEILMYLRKNKRILNEDSIYNVIGVDADNNEKTIEDTLSSETNIEYDYEKNIISEEIRKIIEDLPRRDQLIMMYYFGFYDGEKYSQKEISKMFLISQSYVGRIIDKNLKIVSRRLEKYGYIEASKYKKKTLTAN